MTAANAVVGFYKSAGAVLAHPLRFFQQLRSDSGYRDPLVFLAMCLIVDAILCLFLAKLDWLPPATPGMSRNAEAVLNYLSLPLTPFFLFGLARLFGGQGTFRDAVGVVCYSSATAIVPSISYFGYVVGFYSLFLMYVGMKVRFQLSVRRSVFAFLAFVVLFALVQAGLLYLLTPLLRAWNI